MAIHLERRRSAIEAKMKKEGINQTSNIYTLMDVTRVFGVHHHAVQLWIKKGLLHGRYAPLHRGRNRVWRFADGDIRNFIHDREPTAKWHWRASTSGMDEPTPRPIQLDKLVKGVEAYSDAADLSRNMTQMNYPRQNKVVGIVDFVRTFCYDVAKDIATKLSPSDRARVIRWSNEQVSRLATLPPGAAMPNDILVASMILRQILPGAKDVDL
jgi:hypothetical protein